MKLIDSASFLAWAESHRIGRSPEYPRSENLIFPGEAGTWYRYRINAPQEALAQFVERTVRIAAADRAVWIYPPFRGGMWRADPDDRFWWAPSVRAAVRLLAIPSPYTGAVYLNATDYSHATRLLTVAVESCGTWPLTVIPDHGQCVLSADLDDALLGWFPHEPARHSFTRALKAAGWQEPDEPDPRVSETDPWLDV